MKIMNIGNGAIGLILLMLTIIVAVGAVNAQKKLESRGGMTVVESTFKERVHPEPPKAVKGVEREFVDEMVCGKIRRSEVYPDKFVVWTTDSAKTVAAIGNPKLIKKISFFPHSKWAITVMTGDGKSGIWLKERLLKTPYVYRAENYVYDSKYEYERYPTDMISILLKEESDSALLKNVADSLHLLCYNNERAYAKEKWTIHLGPETPGSRKEIRDIIARIVKPEICDMYWDYDRSYMQEFTMDPYVRDQ